jgi:hypothetical protein
MMVAPQLVTTTFSPPRPSVYRDTPFPTDCSVTGFISDRSPQAQTGNVFWYV